MRSHLSTSAAAALVMVLAVPAGARAEDNPLLPFWAQPYPTGYALAEGGRGRFVHDCTVAHRIRTRHGFRTVIEDRCRPVLHARD